MASKRSASSGWACTLGSSAGSSSMPSSIGSCVPPPLRPPAWLYCCTCVCVHARACRARELRAGRSGEGGLSRAAVRPGFSGAVQPLAARVAGRILCLHGGLGAGLVDIDQIRALQRRAARPHARRLTPAVVRWCALHRCAARPGGLGERSRVGFASFAFRCALLCRLRLRLPEGGVAQSLVRARGLCVCVCVCVCVCMLSRWADGVRRRSVRARSGCRRPRRRRSSCGTGLRRPSSSTRS